MPITRSELLEFMRSQRLAVQASHGGLPLAFPQAAVVGVAVTDDFEIVFDTLASTRKARNLRACERIALVLGGMGAGDERTVQYEGFAHEPSGAELLRAQRAYFRVFPDGHLRLAWPGITYFLVRPWWLRFSDFSRDPPEIVELAAEQLRDLA